MNSRTIFRRISPYILNIWTFSFLLAIPVGKYLVGKIQPFRVKIEQVPNLKPDRYYYYSGKDTLLNNFSVRSQGAFDYITSFQHDGSIINQWNPHGSLNGTIHEHSLVQDMNKDSLIDYAGIYIREDSVFFVFIEVEKGTSPYLEVFLDTFIWDERNPYPVYSTKMLYFYSKKKNKEFVMVSLVSGFGYTPRDVYRVDIASGEVKKAGITGTGLYELHYQDMDLDGEAEFFGRNRSPGNIRKKDEVLFSDSSVWRIILDEDLNFELPVIETKTPFSSLNIEALLTDTGNFYVQGIYDYSAPSDKYPLEFIDTHGKVVYSDSLEEIDYLKHFIRDSLILIIDAKRKNLYKYHPGEELEELDVRFNKLPESSVGYYCDEAGNPIQFILLRDEIVLLDKDWNPKQKIPAPGLNRNSIQVFTLKPGSRPSRGVILVQNAEDSFEVFYSKSVFYSFRLLVLPAIYFGIAGVLYVFGFIVGYRQQKKYQQEKEISELRFRAVKNQLEPHFLFNSLNSIGHLLITEERMKAYEYLESLSSLLRNAVSSAEEVTVNLKEELSFTQKYLKIEKLRFEEKFNFSIEKEDTIPDNFPVPKMIIQLHAENAIKHALMEFEKGGLLEIKVYRDGRFVVIRIIDNGPGIEPAQVQKTSSGKGLKISQQMAGLYEDITGREIDIKVQNRKNLEGKNGTVVKIRISWPEA